MNRDQDHQTADHYKARGGNPPRKRFQLEKLEERIAPDAHLKPQSQPAGGSGGSSASSGSFSSSYSLY